MAKLIVTCPEENMLDYITHVVIPDLENGMLSGHTDYTTHWDIDSESSWQ